MFVLKDLQYRVELADSLVIAAEEGFYIHPDNGFKVIDLKKAKFAFLAGALQHSKSHFLTDSYIGDFGETNCYVLDLSHFSESLVSALERAGFILVNMRAILAEAEADEFQIYSRAYQLAHWSRRNRYCGVCGSPTRPSERERAKVCSHCDNRIYPQIAPCTIGLVKSGDRILLARSKRMRPGVFSTLAGFIEAGESAEEGFAREVREEVGVEIENMEYFGSQAWPFPGQLMIGFIADYQSGDIVIDDDEIEEAYWFDVDDLPEIPSSYSISGMIIRHYLGERLKG